MLTPMTYDSYHSFPIVMNKLLTFGVVSINSNLVGEQKRLTFVQIPQNLPRYFEIVREGKMLLIPIQEIVRWYIYKLFRNIEIQSVTLFRIIRNGDFMVEETDDMDEAFVDEVKRKIKTRRTARVVRVEIEQEHSAWLLNLLKDRYVIDEDNIFYNSTMIDYTSLWHIVNHPTYKSYQSKVPAPVPALALIDKEDEYIFDLLQKQDVMLHHPFNSFNVVVDMIEKAADDPNVMALKITIYRLAKNSRITNALLRAAENGKHVSVLFEVKARFDEENNIKEGQRLQKAGCFVVYGVSRYKTHTKLLLIVRKNADESITRYVHLSSGNYNEDTAKLYTDISLLTTNETIAQDVSEFFNVITGHSEPEQYQSLITAPGNMRSSLIQLIQQEAQHAKEGKPSGIVIKINSLQDKESIEALYQASQAGVPIHLVVRGMCCLRPGIKGLSDNITVRSLIGDFLEHTRIYYFHNNGQPKVYGGSADMMVRSFDRRIESLFLISDPLSLKMAIHILKINLLDNVNAYELQPDDNYLKVPANPESPINVHQLFFTTTKNEVESIQLFY